MRFILLIGFLVFNAPAMANNLFNSEQMQSCFANTRWGQDALGVNIPVPQARFHDRLQAGPTGPVHYEPGLLVVPRPNPRNSEVTDVHLIQQGEATGSLWWARPAYYPTTLSVNRRNTPGDCRFSTVGSPQAPIVSVGSQCFGRNGGDCPANGMGLVMAVDVRSNGSTCVSMETSHVNPIARGDRSLTPTTALPMTVATRIAQEATLERLQFIEQLWAMGRLRQVQSNLTYALSGPCQNIFGGARNESDGASSSQIRAQAARLLCVIEPSHQSCLQGDIQPVNQADDGRPIDQ